jgi:hypothetical protein
MRQRYDRIDPAGYQRVTKVRDFYRKAAAAGRAVIFTVDQ